MPSWFASICDRVGMGKEGSRDRMRMQEGNKGKERRAGGFWRERAVERMGSVTSEVQNPLGLTIVK